MYYPPLQERKMKYRKVKKKAKVIEEELRTESVSRGRLLIGMVVK